MALYKLISWFFFDQLAELNWNAEIICYIEKKLHSENEVSAIKPWVLSVSPVFSISDIYTVQSRFFKEILSKQKIDSM